MLSLEFHFRNHIIPHGLEIYSHFSFISCSQITKEVLDEGAKVLKVGVTSDEIDRIIHEACIGKFLYTNMIYTFYLKISEAFWKIIF